MPAAVLAAGSACRRRRRRRLGQLRLQPRKLRQLRQLQWAAHQQLKKKVHAADRGGHL